MALLDRELVVRRGWPTSADVRDALTYTKPLPGPTVVQAVTFLGWRLAGLPGAVLMTAAAAGTAALPGVATAHGLTRPADLRRAQGIDPGARNHSDPPSRLPKLCPDCPPCGNGAKA